MSLNRMGRIEGEIQKIVSNVISNELKNPDIKGMISVTNVQISNDLSYANIYVSIFDNSKNSNTPEESLKALNKSKGFVKRELGRNLKLRIVPDIVFKLDTSISYGAHIEEILNDILPQDKDE